MLRQLEEKAEGWGAKKGVLHVLRQPEEPVQ